MINQKPKPLVPWFGGKARMAPIIASKLPEHTFYLEPFGGAAGVLMAKPLSYIEVYNDLHSGIVSLFKVIRDPELCKQLLDLLEFTPYSRDEWETCNHGWLGETDLVEKARKVYVTLAQNYIGKTTNGAWACSGRATHGNKATAFYASFENIKAVSQRLQNVTIENRPALNVMMRFDSLETLMYLDPPYLPETWMGKGYMHEMDAKQHQELLDFLLKAKSKVILSGYPSNLYTETLEGAGWIREDFTAYATSAMRTNRNGLKNKPTEVFKRTECLWFSPNANPKTLWNQEREVI